MPEPPLDFMALISDLTRNGVRFVLIGGLAMIAHGSAQSTQDVDFAYARDRENLVRLASTMSSVKPRLRGAPPDLPFVLDERTLKNTSNLTLETEVGPIDLLGEVAGVSSFEMLWERSSTIEVFGIPVHVASLDDLIAMKQAAGRPKDLNHLLELKALREQRI